MTDFLTLDCRDPVMRAYSMENQVYVSGLVTDAKWLKRSAADVKRHSAMLRALPGFHVPAGDALWEAELALMEALNAVRDARKKFEVEVDHE